MATLTNVNISTMSAVWSRRIAFTLKDYFVYSFRGTQQLMRAPAVSCSTATGTPSTDLPSQSENKQTETFDPTKVEELIAKQTKLDMPIEMPNPYEREKLQCILCKYQVHLDYKNVRLLSQFISPYTGRIYGRHITRLCRRQQAILEREIQKSRDAGFMAVMLKSVEFLKDPKLFDPNNPVRPHKY